MKLLYCIILTLFSTTLFAQHDLATAAQLRLKHFIVYDGSYQSIAYPNGDVDAHIGVCSDVIIRSYRTLGIDLQKLVHQDMSTSFDDYPKIWGLSKTDTNIDHRRVPNLEVFFTRKGSVLPLTNNPEDYQPGDLVSWRLDNNLPHIGIVSKQPSTQNPKRFKIIHNIGLGPQLEDVLFDYKIVGHFRY
jgi:uncharacterized protein YijF (DUF1287 family)